MGEGDHQEGSRVRGGGGWLQSTPWFSGTRQRLDSRAPSRLGTPKVGRVKTAGRLELQIQNTGVAAGVVAVVTVVLLRYNMVLDQTLVLQ